MEGEKEMPATDTDRWYCYDCCEYHENGFEHDYDTDDGYGDPDEDAEYYEGGGIPLMGYSYKPIPNFLGEGPLYFGMEVEITTHDVGPALKIVSKHAGYDLVYAKRDGSVQGFELVTHPMSYEWAMKEFPWRMLPALRQAGCTVQYANNGIHVHVSREGFTSPAHEYKWMKFFYRNEGDISRIARRTSSWGTFSPDARKGQLAHAMKHGKRNPHLDTNRSSRNQWDIHPGRWVERGGHVYDTVTRRYQQHYVDVPDSRELYGYRSELQRIPAGTPEGIRLLNQSRPRPGNQPPEDTTLHDRYNAINTTNEQTFEVRVFASTLNPVKAQSALQLCDATIGYAGQLTSHDVRNGGWTWQAFQDWYKPPGLYHALERMDNEMLPPRSSGSD